MTFVCRFRFINRLTVKVKKKKKKESQQSKQIRAKPIEIFALFIIFTKEAFKHRQLKSSWVKKNESILENVDIHRHWQFIK